MKTILLIALTTVLPGLAFAAWDAAATKSDQPPAPPPQIEIEGKFFTIPASAAERLGLTRSPGETKAKWRNILSAAEHQELIKLLSAEKGVTVMSSPRVTTKSGQRAVVEIIHEFRYPTAFVEDKKSEGLLTPAKFETRNIGVSMEIEPKLGAGDLIDMQVIPNLTGFDRFVTYDGGKTVAEPPKSRSWFSQPIFDTMRNMLETTLRSGDALLLGGAEWHGWRNPLAKLDPDVQKPEPDPSEEPRLLFVTVSAQLIKMESPPPGALAGPVEVAVQLVNVASDRLPVSLLPDDRLPADILTNQSETTDTRAFPIAGVLTAADLVKMRAILKTAGAEFLDGPTKLMPRDGRYFVEANGVLRYPGKSAGDKPRAEAKNEMERMDLHVEVSTHLFTGVVIDVDTRMMLNTSEERGGDANSESKAPVKWKYYDGEAPHWPERSITTSVSVFNDTTIMFARSTAGHPGHLQLLLISVKTAGEKGAGAPP